MSACICEGNWRGLVERYEPHFGKMVENKNKDKYLFEGLLWASDDYYFVLTRKNCVPVLITCCVDLFEEYQVIG